MNRGQSHNTKALRRVLTLLMPHAGMLTLGSLSLLLGVAVNLSFPKLIGRFLVAPEFSLPALSSPVVAIIGLFTLQAAAIYVRSRAFGAIGQRVVAELRVLAFATILKQPLEMFDRERIGDLSARVQVDTSVLQQAISVHLPVFARYGLQVIGGTAAMLSISALLTGAVVVALALVLGVSFILARRLRVLTRAQQGLIGKLAGLTEESFGAIRLVKGFGREDAEIDRFIALNDQALSAGIARLRTASFLQSFGSWLLNIVLTCIIVGSVVMAADGRLTPADLSAFLLYGLIIGVSFALATSGMTEFVQALGAVDRIFDLTGPSQSDAPTGEVYLQPKGALSFKDVSFAYPTRSDTPVLREFSLEIQASSWIGVVGPSGSGKSTLGHLLLRFYEPTAGSITLDGRDLGSIDSHELRRKVSSVSQEVYVFHLSLRENLKLGNPSASQEEIETVCDEIGLLPWIQSLPDGFETIVGDRGVQMSGGQRQRVAIARVLLRNPSLLILDEATSALDSSAEEQVMGTIRRRMEGNTVLIIAHRLTSLRDVDMVAVLLEGRLVQYGTPQTLRSEPGLFQTLWTAQAGG